MHLSMWPALKQVGDQRRNITVYVEYLQKSKDTHLWNPSSYIPEDKKSLLLLLILNGNISDLCPSLNSRDNKWASDFIRRRHTL